MGKKLFGRECELSAVVQAVSAVETSGGALVLCGDAGIGKSALLDIAECAALERGMNTLAAVGAPTEARISFAGLHQVLRPLRHRIDDLPSPERSALLVAFGEEHGPPPDAGRIAMAALDLLAESASSTPLLLRVEDAHWLDQPTRSVLEFVARRLSSEPIVMLVAERGSEGHMFADADMRRIDVGPLTRDAAESLLDASPRPIDARVRLRVLEEAAGNPLALIELPGSIVPEASFIGSPLDQTPLTSRLERAFASQLEDLPSGVRVPLLLAATDPDAAQSEIYEAAAVIGGAILDPHELESAVPNQLIKHVNERLEFRHPLIRSAMYQTADPDDRRAAHLALAEVAKDQERRIWHRAAAVVGEDEQVAGDLESIADRAAGQGAIATSVAALERAGQLSPSSTKAVSRLIRAAELGIELGQPDVVARLLEQTEPLELSEADQARLLWVRAVSEPGPPGEPTRMRELIDTADRIGGSHLDLALKLLWAAATSGFWADKENILSGEIVRIADRLPASPRDPWLTAVLAYAEPVERGGAVTERVSALAPTESAPDAMWLISAAAATVGAFDSAALFATAAVDGLRAQGRLSALVRALVLRAWCHIHLGEWEVALSDAGEADQLGDETAQPIWRAGAWVALSILAGIRGDDAEAERRAIDAERVGLQLGARAVLSVTQRARGMTALGQGRHDDAYTNLERMFNKADPAYHRMESCWAVGLLAEAAVHSGHASEARAILAGVEPLCGRTPSPWLHVAVRYARAVLADTDEAEARFLAGLAAATPSWPMEHARLLLAYGEWLRRQRRVADSRGPLREARDAFDRLAVASWGDRAREELAASGESSRERTPMARDRLTPQELRIARMAADGLTNREIGQRLYLTHRTVGFHLYRIFPKLGVTSRAQLASALASLQPPPR